ncbi:MAG: cytochrome c oxidase subunit II [Bacillota bacterium]
MFPRHHLARRAALLLLTCMAAILTGCWRDLPQAWSDPRGPVAEFQLDLFSLSLYISIGLALLVILVLVYIIFRFRQREGEKREALQIHGNSKLEIAWTLLPILILAAVSIPTVNLSYRSHTADSPADVKVKAIGKQFFFHFEYPDLGIVTGNEMVIPAGKTIVFELGSNDVIHSFWVPKLAGKTDMIPGRTNTLWFRADEPGMYWGHCAEFCGASHAQMRFRVRAVTPAEFDAWVAKWQKPAVESTEAAAQAGKALFFGAKPAKAACYACHAIQGSKAQANVGPNLTRLSERSTLGAGLIANTEENLKAWIRNPALIKPGNLMPGHPNLTEEELDQLVQYLYSIK